MSPCERECHYIVSNLKVVSQKREKGGSSGNQHPQNCNSLGNPLDGRTKLYIVGFGNFEKSPEETYYNNLDTK